MISLYKIVGWKTDGTGKKLLKYANSKGSNWGIQGFKFLAFEDFNSIFSIDYMWFLLYLLFIWNYNLIYETVGFIFRSR